MRSGRRVRFFFGTAIGITAVLPNRIVKRHSGLPHNGGHLGRVQLVFQQPERLEDIEFYIG